MAQTGASFEESLGMLTSITEITRSANKASRGLVSIGSRLVQIVDDSSSTGKALKEIYEQLGIQLFDTEGQLRSSYDIFYDLSQIWDSLDTNTQNYIASVQAGTNQFQNFAAWNLRLYAVTHIENLLNCWEVQKWIISSQAL